MKQFNMAPAGKKKRILASTERMKERLSVAKKEKIITDGNSDQETLGKAKHEGFLSARPSKNQPDILLCGNSVKTKTDVKQSFSNSNYCQSKTFETLDIPGTSIDQMNVDQLLALGEQSHMNFSSSDADNDFQVTTDSDSDFEEVKNVDIKNPVIPKDGVNITLNVSNLYNKREKKDLDLAVHLKRQMNRVRKDLQLLMHKVHVLCWIGHLQFVNKTLNNPSLLQSWSSLVKSKNIYPSKYADIIYLEGLLKWYHKNFELKKNFVSPLCTGGLFEEIKYQIEQKKAFSCRAFIFIFIILLRALGLKARVVMSFRVLPVKPSLLELYGNKFKTGNKKFNESETEKKSNNNETEVLLNKATDFECLRSAKRKSSDNSVDQKKKKKGRVNKQDEAQDQKEVSDNNELESRHFRNSVITRTIKSKTVTKLKGINAGSNYKAWGKKFTVTKKPLKNIVSNDDDENDDDHDFTPVSLTKKNKQKINRKLVPEVDLVKRKDGSDVWVEVFLEAEEKWLCVDVPRQKIHCINEIYSRATHPIVYVIACNNDSSLKDVTKRYVPNWHSDTRKRRVDATWWDETMRHFLPARTAQDKEEDEDINRQLLDQPLPSSISEFKDHPLYALKRHLLKFEAIYPPDAPTLGFVRGEPVYARECVVMLHSREMWYKQARLVRLKEEPYKIVKARPKYDKMTGEIKKDLPLELFGKWQTEEYIPPVATDGKIPRNEYGNVDLFKPCMLPVGTVHLQIPALNRIAKKLNIDCAPATVGFDFHSGGSHPVFDGFVVCEEFKDILLDAWNKEIDESVKKGEEKKEKRVYGNWKRLIRALLIREKLKIKYAFGENSEEEYSTKLFARTSTSSI